MQNDEIIIAKNIADLINESNWLLNLIRCRVFHFSKTTGIESNFPMRDKTKRIPQRPETDFDLLEKSLTDEIKHLDPPVLDSEAAAYAGIVNENNLGFNDRLLLILALIPHIDLNMLDDELMENDERLSPLVGGVKGINSGLFLPTGQTFIFLTCGNDAEKRLNMLHWLSHVSQVINGNVIRILPVQEGELFLSGILSVNEYYLQLILTNYSNKPEPNFS